MSMGEPRKRRSRAERDAIRRRRAERAEAAQFQADNQGALLARDDGRPNVIPIRRGDANPEPDTPGR